MWMCLLQMEMPPLRMGMCLLRMETPLRGRSGGYTGAAPTISRMVRIIKLPENRSLLCKYSIIVVENSSSHYKHNVIVVANSFSRHKH